MNCKPPKLAFPTLRELETKIIDKITNDYAKDCIAPTERNTIVLQKLGIYIGILEDVLESMHLYWEVIECTDELPSDIPTIFEILGIDHVEQRMMFAFSHLDMLKYTARFSKNAINL